jgi:hypothetical protein
MSRLSRWEKIVFRIAWPIVVALLFCQVLLTGHP